MKAEVRVFPTGLRVVVRTSEKLGDLEAAAIAQEVLSRGTYEWYSRIKVFVWQCDRCGAVVTGESYLDLNHKVRAHMERCGR